MADYRVHVPRMSYRGCDRRKLEKQRRDHELCALIEEELQRRYDEIEPGEIRAIMSYQVAYAIGGDPEEVRRIICRVQGGSNGVTFGKPALPGGPIPREPEPKPLSHQASRSGQFSLGQRVEHSKFGNGKIVHIEDNKLEIAFETAGLKRVMEDFVMPSRP